MRITAGRFKGRALTAPDGFRVRPTSDKVRQAIFNILEHNDFPGFQLRDARVIDLFAGTGALGLEALSRGARYGLFVEQDAEVRALIRRNVELLGLTGATKVWRRDAVDLGRCINEPSDLAFLDPPYRKELIVPALMTLRAGGWLRNGAIVVAETAEDEDSPSTDGFIALNERSYGETKITILQLGAH